ncbi:MAG: VWA-like domain-containing protein [Woeseiaceae bacterium]|nr:VWA-like domain-containing protein [Woeseiaceae bacterium]
MDRLVSAYLVKLRRDHPFLATLSLYMDYQFTDAVALFDTDGRRARVNPRYFESLNSDQQLGLLLHVTMHSALLHTVRCGSRIKEVWNIACDIVVNEIVADTSFEPPPGTAIEPRYADQSAEQVYTKLLKSATKVMVATMELQSSDDGDDGEQPVDSGIPAVELEAVDEDSSESCDQNGQSSGNGQKGDVVAALQAIYPTTPDLVDSDEQPQDRSQRSALEGYWKRAMTRAQTVERMAQKSQGDTPEGLKREIEQVVNPQLDWRVMLWRFVTKTPCDFSGYDRRFIHGGLYLDNLEGESLNLHIAVDTSGSISDEELAQFRAEVASIIRCYDHIEAKIYFVDADVYGPYPLSSRSRIPDAEGGGGTSFSVFFDAIEDKLHSWEPTVCVYFTDGYGDFPERTPTIPVLWVVTDEGSDYYPFGEVTRFTY